MDRRHEQLTFVIFNLYCCLKTLTLPQKERRTTIITAMITSFVFPHSAAFRLTKYTVSQKNFIKQLITICVRCYYNLREPPSVTKCHRPYYKMHRLDSVFTKCCSLYYITRTLLQGASVITKQVVITKCRRTVC